MLLNTVKLQLLVLYSSPILSKIPRKSMSTLSKPGSKGSITRLYKGVVFYLANFPLLERKCLDVNTIIFEVRSEHYKLTTN